MLSHNFPSERDPTRASFILKQATMLKEAECDIQVIAPVARAPSFLKAFPSYRPHVQVDQHIPARKTYAGFTILHPRFWKLPRLLDLGTFGPFYYRGIRPLVRALFQQEPFDIIHGQMLVPEGYAAARIGQELGIPAVATERGYASIQARGRPWERAALRWTLENLDQTVFVSQSLADAILRLKHEPDYRERIARQGYQKFKSELTPAILGKALVARLDQIKAKPRSFSEVTVKEK